MGEFGGKIRGNMVEGVRKLRELRKFRE